MSNNQEITQSNASRPDEKIIRPYGKYATLIKNTKTGEVFIRHVFPKNDPNSYWRAVRAVEATKLSSRHPNMAMPLLATRHKNGDIDVEVEFADGGSLSMYIKLMRDKFTSIDNQIRIYTENGDIEKVGKLIEEKKQAKLHQIQMAKSVARQLLDYCLYLSTVLGQSHKNLNPHTVLFRRDGCVKTTFVNYLDKNYIKTNRYHFLEFNAYVAPEVVLEKTSIDLVNIDKKLEIRNNHMFNKNNIERDNLELHKSKNTKIIFDLFLKNRKTLVDGFINSAQAVYTKNTNESISESAVNRIKNSDIRSDIWSIGAILYSIMTCTDLMPEWGYLEPIYTNADNNRETYDALYQRKIKDVDKWTQRDEMLLNIELEEHLTREKQQNSTSHHISKYRNFIEFVVGADYKMWSDTFGNDPYLTYIARKCLDVEKMTRGDIYGLNSFVYLAGGFVTADPRQPYQTPDNRYDLRPIVSGKVYDKLTDDPNGDAYAFKHDWKDVWDAFSTDCAVLTTPRGYNKKEAQLQLMRDGLVALVEFDDISPDDQPSTADAEYQRLSRLQNSYYEETYGDAILRELSYFYKTRFGKIYTKEYCGDKTITNEMILDKNSFPYDLIDPDMSINVANEHVIWILADKRIYLLDIIGYLQLESRSFRKRRNYGKESIVDIEKKRRKLTAERQKCAWIALSRACVFFREGYTKP